MIPFRIGKGGVINSAKMDIRKITSNMFRGIGALYSYMVHCLIYRSSSDVCIRANNFIFWSNCIFFLLHPKNQLIRNSENETVKVFIDWFSFGDFD